MLPAELDKKSKDFLMKTIEADKENQKLKTKFNVFKWNLITAQMQIDKQNMISATNQFDHDKSKDHLNRVINWTPDNIHKYLVETNRLKHLMMMGIWKGIQNMYFTPGKSTSSN